MRTRAKSFCLLAGLTLGMSADAEQWFNVAGPGADAAGTRVEVDLDSVRPRGAGGEGVIRVSFAAQQPHSAGFHFRSFTAIAQFDCQRRNVRLSSAAYYAQPAGKGSRLGVDSAGREGGMPPGLLDSIPPTAQRALLRATCATTRTPAA